MINGSGLILQSPNGLLTASLRLTHSGLQYDLNNSGIVILEDSDIGITANGIDLGCGAVIEAVRQAAVHETYDVRGGHARAVNHCNELVVTLRKDEWTCEL